jgi:predicted Zn-dependent protease
MFQSMVSEFPDSPMGHFSLGKYFLEKGRFAESTAALKKAVELDKDYAAAWVALGDAHAAAGDTAGARDAWQRALETPHGKRDLSLQSDLEQRMQDLS